MATNYWRLTAILTLILLASHTASAAVIGFFETQSGHQGIVMAADDKGFGPVDISVTAPGDSSPQIVNIGNERWKLLGDKVIALGAVQGIRGTQIGVSIDQGIFHMPPFGATFFLGNGKVAKIYFETKQGRVNEIELPIHGGEIKGFKVFSDHIDLLVFDRKSKRIKSKDGRELFGVAPAGENILISVKPDRAGPPQRLSSKDPGIFWSDNGRLFYVDEKTLELRDSNNKKR